MGIVRLFRRTLLREMDFTYERRNLENFADISPTMTPSTSRRCMTISARAAVVTMEQLNGIRGSDCAALNDAAKISRSSLDAGRTCYLENGLRDAFYHADPHPGNLMLMPGCVVGVLDCGQVGSIDDELREDVEALLFAIVEHDSAQVTDMVLRLGSVPPVCQRDRLRIDLDDFLSD